MTGMALTDADYDMICQLPQYQQQQGKGEKKKSEYEMAKSLTLNIVDKLQHQYSQYSKNNDNKKEVLDIVR